MSAGWTSRWWRVPAERLGWLRVVVGSSVIWHLSSSLGTYSRVAQSPPNMFKGVGVTTLLDGAIAPELFMGLTWATLALSVLVVLGWRTRVVAPIWAATLLFVLTYRTSWVQIYHSDNLMALQAIVLALAPAAGASVSLDARAGRNQGREPWEFAWPIVLMCAVTLLAYMIAGASKIAGSAGWEWAWGTTLRDQIAYNAINKELLGGAPDAAARWAYDHPYLLRPGSVLALVLEAGAPFALLHRRLGKLWALGAFGMHWGIYHLMGIAFTYPLYGWAFAAFFDLERGGGFLLDRAQRLFLAAKAKLASG
jgi:hypothetical protein